MNFWFIHLAHGSCTKDVLVLLFNLLQEPHVLTWISTAAKRRQLRGLVDAPQCMVAIANMLGKLYTHDENAIEQHKAIELLTSWATDLVNIVGNLISYGRKAVKVWKILTGECLRTINNPANNPIPQAIVFLDQHNCILVLGRDRCIRSFATNGGNSAEWKINPSTIDRDPEETKLKEPICSTFSPDGNMIAFGYSGHLVTVWETQRQKVVSRLCMKFHKENISIPKYVDGEGDNLLWHPSSREIIGLQRDGLLFKRDPYDEESIIKVRVERAYRVTISRDGSRLATGDGEHVIKIFATADLSLLHNLSNQGSIRSLSFSTDSRRVYDVRGKYGNVWEPSILVDPKSTIRALAHKEDCQFSRAQNITAICGQSIAPIYCYSTENGPTMLREVGSRIVWLENESDNVPIHKLALSDNGSLAAIVDMSGNVSIKVISRDYTESESIQILHGFAVNIGRGTGIISRLLFHPEGRQLFVDTTCAVYTVNINTHAVVSSAFVRRMAKIQWICHPTNPDYILGFSDTLAYVLNWDNLEEVATLNIFRLVRNCTRNRRHTNLYIVKKKSIGDSKEQQAPNTKTRIPDILLEISNYEPLGQPERVHLGFSVTDIKVGSNHQDRLAGDLHSPSNKLPYTVLPQDVTSHTRAP